MRVRKPLGPVDAGTNQTGTGGMSDDGVRGRDRVSEKAGLVNEGENKVRFG